MTDDPERAPTPGEGRPKPRRFAPLLLVAGGIAAIVTLFPHMPKERRLELRLDDASSIVAVDLSVVRESDGEAVQGNAWHFAAGSAPTSLTTSVSMIDTRYAIDVTVERTQGRVIVHRVLSPGDSDQIAIPVREK